MRDYKNIKVPRSYRVNTKRTSIKRVNVGRISGRPGASPHGLTSVALQVLVVIIILAGAWLGWQAYLLVTHAEMFQIAGVDVKGAKQLGEADLKAIAGAFTGQNIFQVDLEAAVRRARAHPWIKDVRIYRQLPNRISMVFAERVPAAVLDTGSNRYLLDSDAVIIDRIAKETSQAWPFPVVAIKDLRARPGEQVTTEGMREAQTLLAEIAARGGWQPVDVTIRAGSPESLTLVYKGHEFKIGSGNYPEKLRRLAEIMDDVKLRGLDIAYVDLRPERQAAVMVSKNSTVFKVQSSAKKKKRQ